MYLFFLKKKNLMVDSEAGCGGKKQAVAAPLVSALCIWGNTKKILMSFVNEHCLPSSQCCHRALSMWVPVYIYSLNPRILMFRVDQLNPGFAQCLWHPQEHIRAEYNHWSNVSWVGWSDHSYRPLYFMAKGSQFKSCPYIWPKAPASCGCRGS